MVCIICLAAAAVLGAGLLGPDLINTLQERLKNVLPDARKVVESDSVVKWQGTFSLQAGPKKAEVPVAVYLYKGQKRLRIQVLTHRIDRAQAERVEDAIARALDATIVARTFPDAEHMASEEHDERIDWVPEASEALPVEERSGS